MICPVCQRENTSDHAFCGGCGTRLGEGRTPGAYTPRHLAARILTLRSALEGERKQVTVLFADVIDSTALSADLDPEQWHRIMDRFFAVLADGVHRFEGTVNQFTGDGIMALFGAPLAHEDHALRACHAALELRDEVGRYAQRLQRQGLRFAARMGLNSGEVVVGKIGDDLRMDYTAQGHTTALAARIEQIAEPGSVFLTERTARLVEGYFELRDRGAQQLKGVPQPVRAFELVGIGPLRTRLDASRARGLAPLVGREPELAVLEAALARALEGEGRAVSSVRKTLPGSAICSTRAARAVV